jgi:predicted DCC family thiol-disulfide oxidoreductase YuxK
VPRWEARYEELAMAELVTLPHSRIAAWLRLQDQQGGIGFIRMPSGDALMLLEEHGVPVDRSVARVRRVQELYRA